MYLGPVTWMPWRGRWCSKGKYLHCCDPAAYEPHDKCPKVPLTQARSTVVAQLAAAFGNGTLRRGMTAPAAMQSRRLTLLEFHWPDSGLGRWGEPHTFLQMLPQMHPARLPSCRVVVTTLLRDPVSLYPSLQLHQYPSMRGYAPPSLNLSACDYESFVAAFPNFQGWRLTSREWVQLPLRIVGHEAMFSAASRLLRRLDLVGVTERMDEWVELVCVRAGIAPCPTLKHLNDARRSYAPSSSNTTPQINKKEPHIPAHTHAHTCAYTHARIHGCLDRRTNAHPDACHPNIRLHPNPPH